MATLLLRGEDQAVVIGPQIRVRVRCIHDDQVELVIEAPEEIPVYREEVAEDIRGLMPGLRPRLCGAL